MSLAEEDITLSTIANFGCDYDWVDIKAAQRVDKDKQAQSQPRVRCHNCGGIGHKSTYCQENQIELE
jgi:hypothetical protein